jgi:hypothetical protein
MSLISLSPSLYCENCGATSSCSSEYVRVSSDRWEQLVEAGREAARHAVKEPNQPMHVLAVLRKSAPSATNMSTHRPIRNFDRCSPNSGRGARQVRLIHLSTADFRFWDEARILIDSAVKAGRSARGPCRTYCSRVRVSACGGRPDVVGTQPSLPLLTQSGRTLFAAWSGPASEIRTGQPHLGEDGRSLGHGLE